MFIEVAPPFFVFSIGVICIEVFTTLNGYKSAAATKPAEVPLTNRTKEALSRCSSPVKLFMVLDLRGSTIVVVFFFYSLN